MFSWEMLFFNTFWNRLPVAYLKMEIIGCLIQVGYGSVYCDSLPSLSVMVNGLRDLTTTSVMNDKKLFLRCSRIELGTSVNSDLAMITIAFV